MEKKSWSSHLKKSKKFQVKLTYVHNTKTTDIKKMLLEADICYNPGCMTSWFKKLCFKRKYILHLLLPQNHFNLGQIKHLLTTVSVIYEHKK